MLLLATVSTCAGLVFGTILATEEQAIPFAVPIGIGMAMLGGCMWPLEVVSPAVRAVGHLTPHAWAMDAFIVLQHGGAGIGSVWRSVVALAAFAVALLAMATRNMRRMVVGH